MKVYNHAFISKIDFLTTLEFLRSLNQTVDRFLSLFPPKHEKYAKFNASTIVDWPLQFKIMQHLNSSSVISKKVFFSSNRSGSVLGSIFLEPPRFSYRVSTKFVKWQRKIKVYFYQKLVFAISKWSKKSLLLSHSSCLLLILYGSFVKHDYNMYWSISRNCIIIVC